ncbi:Persulfide dioxygenase ETHE1, mitochondrial [Chlamydiales bacterium SCGC AB-751-O23]|jgi:sulfur dioxygenase|nr:Persulfide dioxygenase ETHE1, mitochondrial [Chlamydiales bacterium SCGC AB-751-O23]
MIFKQLFEPVSCTYTYLIASGEGREALIIDPVFCCCAMYEKLINELDLKLVVALDTHLHADHVTGTGKLKESQNCKIAMGMQTKAEMVDYRFKESEEINIDGLKIKTIYTPGHTDDSYSFFLNDRLFTGDTLLIRGTGRTDFQHGDPKAQYDSIVNKLFGFPEKTLVYPGHDYKGMTVSSIREEKAFNPRLKDKTEEQYISIMNNLNLPNPKMMDIAVPANIKCGKEYKTPSKAS